MSQGALILTITSCGRFFVRPVFNLLPNKVELTTISSSLSVFAGGCKQRAKYAVFQRSVKFLFFLAHVICFTRVYSMRKRPASGFDMDFYIYLSLILNLEFVFLFLKKTINI